MMSLLIQFDMIGDNPLMGMTLYLDKKNKDGVHIAATSCSSIKFLGKLSQRKKDAIKGTLEAQFSACIKEVMKRSQNEL